MLLKIWLNTNRFFTAFALFRKECRSAQINEVGMNFFLELFFFSLFFELFFSNFSNFFSTRSYLYHFEYIEFGRKIMFIKILLNKNVFFLLVLHCLALVAEVQKWMKWELIFTWLGPTCTVSNASNLEGR